LIKDLPHSASALASKFRRRKPAGLAAAHNDLSQILLFFFPALFTLAAEAFIFTP